MNVKLNGTKVVSNEVRFSYAHVFEPQAIGDSADLKYSTAILIDKSNAELIDAINLAITAAIELGKNTKWGGKVPKGLKLPLRDGDKERDGVEYQGTVFLNASCKTKPVVLDTKRNQLTSDDFYSGCYGAVSINFFPFDAKGNRGVACGLNNILKTRDGEPLAGRSNAFEDFKDLLEEDDFM